MRKYILVIVLVFVFALSSCTQSNEIECSSSEVDLNGVCEEAPVVCDEGYIKEEGQCVLEEEDEACSAGYHEVEGQCVIDDIVLPDWFTGWSILEEPVGNTELSELTFSDDGFSVYLSGESRVGIQLRNLTLSPGFYYEVKFDYSSSVAGKGIFVQLQGHGGYEFTNPGVITSESVQTFSQILPFPSTSNGTTDGSFTIELTPSVAGEVTISNIELIETALPTCGENQVISGIVCIASNNGFLPNGTPTAWFDDWELLTIPPGDKEISDYNFTETGYTAYLRAGERTGIQIMDYVFESGYTYELSFDYTSSEPGRMIWVQMVALGGYEFTNTETWTINGTATFTQSLTIPSTYVPTEPGWIKLELTPSALDNITIENIVITKTPN